MKLMLRFCLLALLFTNCQKKKSTPEPEPEPAPVQVNPGGKGSVKLEFNNMVDTLPLIFNQDYLSPAGESYKVTKFNYYISNIALINKDGTIFYEPESYHLIQHSVSSSTTVTMANVPAGEYTGITFLIGVDSLRNCSGAQTGELDPAKGMFWTWSSGYIFMKFEAFAPTSTLTTKTVAYHIGGYKGPDKTQRYRFLNFNWLTANVTDGTQTVISFKANVNELLKTPVAISFSTTSDVTAPGPGAKILADNYADMITFIKITK